MCNWPRSNGHPFFLFLLYDNIYIVVQLKNKVYRYICMYRERERERERERDRENKYVCVVGDKERRST